MPCSSCANNGNSLGCPCQEQQKDNCPITFQNGKTVYRDPCTGETKRALPYVTQQKDEFDVVAVKIVPKKKNPCAPVKQPCQERKCCKPERKTQCYTCPPKRADAYPADHKCYKLEYLDAFENFEVGQTPKDSWNYFTDMKEFTADDGVQVVKKNGLLISAREFKKTYSAGRGGDDDDDPQSSNGFLDHIKYFSILNSDFPVPECGELYTEACIAARTYGTEKHPFGDAVLNPHSDFRLAYASFSMIDFDSGLHIAHIITNDSLYALYERLPLDNEDGTDDDIGSACFAFAHLIGRRNYRNPLNDFARLGLAIDKRKGAKYYVNGVLKHTIDRLGHLHDPAEALYQLGGEPTDISPKCMHIGLGLFSMLDAVSPSNHGDLEASGTGLVRLTGFDYQHPWVSNRQVQFVNDSGDKQYRLFGQGAALKVKEVKVELRA